MLRRAGGAQIRELGRGQFGSVWMAKWLGVEVAIKELLGQNTPRARAEMYGEAEMLAALRHPCVIAIYGLVVNQACPAPLTLLHTTRSSGIF